MNLQFVSGQSLDQAYPNLPTSNEGYQSNNQYEHFPPKMSDGRSVMASWQPGAVVNEVLLQQNGIQSNWQYRKFLTQNSESIKANLFRDALNDVGYSIRNENPQIEQVFQTPKVYGSFQEPITHRQSESSDLKDIYLTREQLQSKQVVPSMTQDELVKMRGY
jgi:hypothetical protein